MIEYDPPINYTSCEWGILELCGPDQCQVSGGGMAIDRYGRMSLSFNRDIEFIYGNMDNETFTEDLKIQNAIKLKVIDDLEEIESEY